jgi:hypothetical protein
MEAKKIHEIFCKLKKYPDNITKKTWQEYGQIPVTSRMSNIPRRVGSIS